MSCPGSSPLTRGKHGRLVASHGLSGLIPAHAGKTVIPVQGRFFVEPHPRSRGENGTSLTCRLRSSGSSPLTRGKRAHRARAPRENRLIPAHAGKTGRGRGPRGGGRAHPRSRGENRGRRREPVKERGSSPLTRGKPRPVACCCPQRRLIPAHAGKTSSDSSSARSAKAHPRSRGENFGNKANDESADGSSPLTRGKRELHAPRRDRRGLIPAHAGKTSRGRPRS